MKKVCLVTGAKKGIGFAVAKQLLDNGNYYVIMVDNDPLTKEFVGTIKDKSRLSVMTADITKEEDMLILKEFIMQTYGGLDCLVCNAGIIPTPCGIDDITDENIDKTIDVNLKGTFRCLRIFGNLIHETSDNGSIVNLTSVDGIIGEPFAVIYSATKAGIISLTKSFARKLGDKVRVNAVAPGIIETDMVKNLPEYMIKPLIDSIPLGRIGQPEDIANAFLFLASDMASYITGTILQVDGAARS